VRCPERPNPEAGQAAELVCNALRRIRARALDPGGVRPRPRLRVAGVSRAGDQSYRARVPMQRCRILLVDANPLLLRVIARFLAEFPELEVVACSTSSVEGMAMAVIQRPDLLVMNLIMPEISGLEVTRRLAAEPWAPRTILMTLHDESEYRRAAEA